MSGLLMGERFVAVFPSLVRRLGSIEAAAILQHLHFNADVDGSIKITMQRISDETGIGLRTVERKVKWLRDEALISAERSASYDATLVYRIDHDALSGTSPASGDLDPDRMADSEPAKVADSSSPTRSSQEGGARPAPAEPVGEYIPTSEPEQHPMRGIRHDWLPRPEFRANLAQVYPDVDLRESHRRFVDHQISHARTSRSWEAEFRKWVSNDSERVKDKRGGTDDLGIPRNQRSVPRTVASEEEEQQQQDLIDLARRSALKRTEQPDD